MDEKLVELDMAEAEARVISLSEGMPTKTEFVLASGELNALKLGIEDRRYSTAKPSQLERLVTNGYTYKSHTGSTTYRGDRTLVRINAKSMSKKAKKKHLQKLKREGVTHGR